MSETVAPSLSSKRWLTRGVLGIGLASLFSDWGHEAATAILPAFLASLGAPAFALGVIEGVSDGLSSFAKLAGGWIADRPRWRKPTGVVGYLATALSTFAYAFAQSWPAILVMRALDEDRRPALCESVSERRKGSCQVSNDSRGFTPSWTICDPAAGQFCETREAVGDALDHAKRKCRRAQTREKCRQDRGSSFVPPVREQTSEADAQDATREPAFCRCG